MPKLKILSLSVQQSQNTYQEIYQALLPVFYLIPFKAY